MSVVSLIGVVGHTLVAGLWIGLALWLAGSWRGRMPGGLLVLAAAAGGVWAAAAALQLGGVQLALANVLVLDAVRQGVWLAFLGRLLLLPGRMLSRRGRTLSAVAIVVAVALIGLPTLAVGVHGLREYALLGPLGLSILGLVLTEQLFRNTRPERRWAIKFLCLGVGGLFAYDFFLYADGSLFRRLDLNLWAARGYAQVLVIPLIAISAARNPQWSLEVFVSRRLVFHSAALVASGLYLLAMAGGGYYLKYFGGHWGVLAQAVFFFGATLVLLLLLFSGRVRAEVRLFFNQHFFQYRYDYREEWLRLTRTLSQSGTRPRECAIEALAALVDSPGGWLWWREERGSLRPSAHWNVPPCSASFAADHPLVSFLDAHDWVIDLADVQGTPELYEGLLLPEALKELRRGWLIVPLRLKDQLVGLIVLAASIAPRQLHWEDNDLLKTAGQQAASHLAQAQAAEALAIVRQFEVFHQLSAFVMHDLKNLIAQLSLVVANAVKHRHNPRFMDDVVDTVENAVVRMERLLAQLRAPTGGVPAQVALQGLLEEIVAAKGARRPVPSLEVTGTDLSVRADREQLATALAHLVQNAQDATPIDGHVRVTLRREAEQAMIAIEDTGCGMDEEFLRERLFRPFDTTKGKTGMGIGAYESRELLRRWGGELEVRSLPGRGSTFTVCLPIWGGEGELVRREAVG